MRTSMRTNLLGLTALLAAAPSLASAQDPITQYVSQDKGAPAPTATTDGFKGSLTLGGSLNVTHNRFMVGQVDGRAVLFGLTAVGAGDYRHGKHEWKGNLNLAETWARTPVVERFVKNNDVLQIDNLYNYFLSEWAGPFAKLDLLTSILPTEQVTATNTDYVNVADATDTDPNRTRFKLANSFQPFTINESVGWFAQPLTSEALTLYGRAGFGGRHTFADGAKIITDTAGTAEVEFTRLDDVHQAGVELFAGLDGKAQNGRLQYAAGVGVLFPLLTNDDTDRSTLELTRVAGQGSLGVGIFDWMSLNYLLKVIRDPQLIDEVQVQNSLLLTVSYSVSTPVEEPAAPAVDPAVAAAEERAAAAEARATAAEARAAAAEARVQAEPPAPAATEPATAPAPQTP